MGDSPENSLTIFIRGGEPWLMGYCWPTSFKVLGVLFLGEVSSAFLPSMKASWTPKFRHVGLANSIRRLCETRRTDIICIVLYNTRIEQVALSVCYSSV